MDRSRAGQWFRPAVIFGVVVLLGVVASFFWDSRPNDDTAIDLGTDRVVTTTDAVPTTGTNPEDESSATTEQGPVEQPTDFGPPVTVGDYTMFCPALDELAALDASRAVVADAGADAANRWQAERRAVLETIDRTLNYRSAEADADMAVLVATADDSPGEGPLSPDAEAAVDRIREFAAYSCEVNGTLPPQSSVVDEPGTTTTQP